MAAMTIRGLDEELSQRLRDESRERGVSMNRLVVALLREGLGLNEAPTMRRDLSDLAGTWTEAEVQEFEAAAAATERIDEELWQ